MSKFGGDTGIDADFGRSYEKDDGWNEDAFENIGLLDVIGDLDQLAYEIRNCVRVTHLDEMVLKLQDAAINLNEIAEELNSDCSC